MLEKTIRNSRGILTSADPQEVLSDISRIVRCQSLVQIGVLSILKISAGNLSFAEPTVSGQYNVTQYLVH